MKSRILNIYINGIHIGRLEKSKQGALQFSYDHTWLDTPGARPLSLSLPLVNMPFSGDIVYNYFDNLLPDNKQIRKRIQSKFRVSSNHPFDLLASIGKDCVGAIQVIENENFLFKKTIRGKVLSEQDIATILQGYQENPLGMTDDFEEFRISISGAQEKTALLYHNKKWKIPIEDTPTSHIFKLPIGRINHQNIDLSDSCENEFLCSQIAKAFGLEVANCSIEHFEDIKVLVVERFDRQYSSDKSWIMRLPQEDMCQALGKSSNLKYQSDGGPGIKDIMNLLLGSQDPTRDRDKFFQSQILFWLLCAIDGHAKNFSLFLDPEGRYRLTPLYDIMSAFPLLAAGELFERKVKMAMALKGNNTHYKWHEGQRSHFISTAKHAGYSEKRAEQLLDEMLDKVDLVIDKVSSEMPTSIPSNIASPIFDGMKKVRNRFSKK